MVKQVCGSSRFCLVAVGVMTTLIIAGCANKGDISNDESADYFYDPIVVDYLDHRHREYRHSHNGGDRPHLHQSSTRSEEDQVRLPIEKVRPSGPDEIQRSLPRRPARMM